MYKTIYSLYSGVCYLIEEDMFKLLDDGQLPLKTSNIKSCNKCYDRRYIGFNADKHVYIPCACIVKITDNNSIKLKFNIQ